MIILEINLTEESIKDIAAASNNIWINLTEQGEQGYTPQKGIDYMTEEDIDVIIKQIEYEAGIDAATEEEIRRLF